MNNKKFKLLMSPCLALALSTSIISYSCASQHQEDVFWIDTISMQSDFNSLKPGNSVQIRIIGQPHTIRLSEIIWEFVGETSQDVHISDSGILSVDPKHESSEIEIIQLKATLKQQPNVSTVEKFYVLPSSFSSGFAGFVDNKIEYVDINGNLQSTNFIEYEKNQFRAAKKIDIYVNESSWVNRPNYFTSWIYFQTIIATSTYEYMQFRIEGEGEAQHGIQWADYRNDLPTTEIPDFDITTPAPLFETITGTFTYDQTITFQFDFVIWQSIDQYTPGVITYSPTEGDHHWIREMLPGSYYAPILCPANLRDGDYYGWYTTIYCSRKKYEYSDFNIKIFVDAGLEPELKNAFEFDYEINVIERPIDHFRFYGIDLYYRFNLSKISHIASYWNYQNFPVLNINVYDANLPSYLVCRCEFSLEWLL